MKFQRKAVLALIIIIIIAFPLINFTTVLGPYGHRNDIYHEVLLITTLFEVYLLFAIASALHEMKKI